jgi:hypothetical protein
VASETMEQHNKRVDADLRRPEDLLGEHSVKMCVLCGEYGAMIYKGIERYSCIWCFLRQCEEMEVL